MFKRGFTILSLCLVFMVAVSGSVLGACKEIPGTRQVEPDGIYIKEQCTNTVEANIISSNKKVVHMKPSDDMVSVDYQVELTLLDVSHKNNIDVTINSFGPNRTFLNKVGDVEVSLEGNEAIQDSQGTFSLRNPLQVSLQAGKTKTLNGTIKIKRSIDLSDVNILSAMVDVDYTRKYKRWKRIGDVQQTSQSQQFETNEGVTLVVDEQKPVACVPGELNQEPSVSPSVNGPAEVLLDKVDANVSKDTHTRVQVTSINDHQRGGQLIDPDFKTQNLVMDGSSRRSYQVSAPSADLFKVSVEYRVGYCQTDGSFEVSAQQRIPLRNPVTR
ncbi:MAG: hypothetical protein ABEJ65_09375 [bacterium]